MEMKFDKENKLTEDELEQVVGGSLLSDDSRFLNVLLRGREGQCERYGAFKAHWCWSSVVRAWNSVGVEILYGEFFGYSYSINGKIVSRDEAWQHAEQVVGKHLQRSDWDW